MKRKFLFLPFLLLSYFISAQFTIKVESPQDFLFKEAFLYSLNGSKDILLDKVEKNNQKLSQSIYFFTINELRHRMNQVVISHLSIARKFLVPARLPDRK